MKQALSLWIAVVIVCLAGSALAQMEMPKPAPELKKVDAFVGSWKLDGDAKPGPMGPGGKMMMTEECRWMEGGYFLECHSKFSGGGMGSGAATAFMGYNSEAKTYTYDEFNSFGQAEHSTGTLDNDTWTWISTEKMNGQSYKGRFLMKMPTPDAYSFQYDMSTDGTNWTNMMQGKATKVK